MKNSRLFALCLRFSLFFSLLFSFSCKKETPTDYTRFPIELTTADVTTGTKLTWTKVETSDFIDYTIVRSTGDSIPELSQLSGNPSAFVITRITDPKLTTFTDPRFSTLAVRTHYRVFARLSGRSLASRNVLINTDILDLGTGFTEIIANNSKDKPRFYLAGSFTTTLLCYDGNDDRIVATGTGLPSTNMRLAVANKNDANEEVAVYSFSNSNIVSFFDATTLKSTGNISFQNASSIVAGIGTPDGFFIFITTESSNNIKVVSLTTHTIVSQTSINFSFTPFTGSVLTKNPAAREVVFRDPSSSSVRVSRIEYNEQGQILNGGLMGFAASGFTTSVAVLRVSPTGDNFIVNNGIYNRSIQLRTSLLTNISNNYTDFTYSTKGDKIYALFSLSNTNIGVDEYDASTFKIARAIPVKVFGLRCFATETALIVFSNGSSSRTTVQKVKL
jgi:hypothetical protein